MLLPPRTIALLLVILGSMLILLATTVLKSYAFILWIVALLVCGSAPVVAVKGRNIGGRVILLVVAVGLLFMLMGFVFGSLLRR